MSFFSSDHENGKHKQKVLLKIYRVVPKKEDLVSDFYLIIDKVLFELYYSIFLNLLNNGLQTGAICLKFVDNWWILFG